MPKRFEKTLTDTAAGIYEETWQIHADELGLPSAASGWCITKFVLRGGKQHGVELVEIDNGEMIVTVIPTRGMNILDAACMDITLGWDSPVKEVVHPSFIMDEARGGLGWLEGFNELVCRCGLESHGAPGPDAIIDNQGNESVVMLPLHGRISNTPASRVWVAVGLEPPHRLTVGGDVYDTRMFGPNYELHTEISTEPGSTEFTVADRVTNIGGKPAEMELLYHCNYGPPILGDGARFVAPVRRMAPRDDVAAPDAPTWNVYGPPTAGFVEECHYFEMYGDRKGRTTVALVAPDGASAAVMRYSTRQLPVLAQWKNEAAEIDGYVTGIEPATSLPNNRNFERSRDRVIVLAPGESHDAELSIGVVRGKSKVKAVCSEIGRIAGKRKSTFRADPDPGLSPA